MTSFKLILDGLKTPKVSMTTIYGLAPLMIFCYTLTTPHSPLDWPDRSMQALLTSVIVFGFCMVLVVWTAWLLQVPGFATGNVGAKAASSGSLELRGAQEESGITNIKSAAFELEAVKQKPNVKVTRRTTTEAESDSDDADAASFVSIKSENTVSVYHNAASVRSIKSEARDSSKDGTEAVSIDPSSTHPTNDAEFPTRTPATLVYSSAVESYDISTTPVPPTPPPSMASASSTASTSSRKSQTYNLKKEVTKRLSYSSQKSTDNYKKSATIEKLTRNSETGVYGWVEERAIEEEAHERNMKGRRRQKVKDFFKGVLRR